MATHSTLRGHSWVVVQGKHVTDTSHWLPPTVTFLRRMMLRAGSGCEGQAGVEGEEGEAWHEGEHCGCDELGSRLEEELNKSIEKMREEETESHCVGMLQASVIPCQSFMEWESFMQFLTQPRQYVSPFLLGAAGRRRDAHLQHQLLRLHQALLPLPHQPATQPPAFQCESGPGSCT
ncbi:hypothetical protein GWK47_047808 [Chionoecetes opilio]|uniref:Uncharacterized protein n=1 Tax=Chionoecetes opilio TaxID=41210 RepID=A0A8J5CUZ3_CHIOP|nr:hypothetical protein GWK47_047808 [Chionoecetes opilio]